MHRLIYVLLLLLPAALFGQPANTITRTSRHTFVYKLTATMVENFTKDSINLKLFEDQQPFKTFEHKKENINSLPHGNYLFVSVNDNKVEAKVHSIFSLHVYTINNLKNIQLVIIDKEGRSIDNARVWVNQKETSFNTQSKTYHVSQRRFEDGFLKIVNGTDTAFAYVYANEELPNPVLLQRWQNFKNSRPAQVLTWLPRQVKNLFKKNHYRIKSTRGMMVFSQPKYKQTDTVKFKAYLFNHRGKMYKRDVNVFLSYRDKGKWSKILLRKLPASSPGSYFYEFPLTDTLPANTQYDIAFENNNDKILLSGAFRIEDYLLDDISNYEFRSDKSIYYPNDTMHFYASATDANGLGVLDVNTTLVLKLNNIAKFDKDSLYVADTLFKTSTPLLAEGDTKFSIPTNCFPKAVIDITAYLQFKNSNNELQEKEIPVSFSAAGTEFKSITNADTITTTYYKNGSPSPANGIMVKHDQWNDTTKIQYPFKIKIDPLATGYTFYRMEGEKVLDSSSPTIERYHNVTLERVSRGDTLALILNNPYAVSVSYSVLDGNKLIGAGKSSEAKIDWTLPAANIRRGYRVVWQYRWLNKEVKKEENIAVLYNILKVEVNSYSNVFPGQKDTVKISVTDYKNQPARNINLTAVAYNNQFSKDINVPDPPNLVTYRLRQHIERDTYYEDNGYVTGNNYYLSNHLAWSNNFGLDSMLYYRTLFPKNGLVDMVQHTSDYPPQVTIHCVRKGVWEPIHMLYINNRLVYYSGVTTKMQNVYEAQPGFTKFGIRLKNKLIELDSIYLQPSYKHDIYIDVDRLPANAKVSDQPSYHTQYEKTLLESRLLRIEAPQDGQTSYLWQGSRLVKMDKFGIHLVGPFQEGDSLHYFAPGQFDIHFLFEPGYQYRLSKKIVRLEKKAIFKSDKAEIKFSSDDNWWSIGDTLAEIPVINYEQKQIPLEPRLDISPLTDAHEVAGTLFFKMHSDSVIKYVVLYRIDSPDNKIVFDGRKRLIQNIAPGNYGLLLVRSDWKNIDITPLTIVANQTLCINTERIPFIHGSSLLYRWWMDSQQVLIERKPDTSKQEPAKQPEPTSVKQGTGLIKGRVYDEQGKLSVYGASIVIKNTGVGAATNEDGSFELNNIAAGKYTLVVMYVGYETKEILVDVLEYGVENVEIGLSAYSSNLQEVVVIGYGAERQKKGLSFSTSVVNNDLSFALSGKAAGVVVQNANGSRVRLRGAASVTYFNDISPLYVIDGVMYEEMPANITNDMIGSTHVLSPAAASALYGSRGAKGAVVLTTKNNIATRTIFRDYALWKPEIFTNKDGNARFEVQYPENITGWQLYVLGMDKKKRIGKAVKVITSYKPLWAELNMPGFLIESDTVEIVGKSVNYTDDSYALQSNFSINGTAATQRSFELGAKESDIKKHYATAPTGDTLTAAYNITSTSGFKDGEQKRILILKRGVMQSDGQFWMLTKDTTFSFSVSNHNESINIYAVNNTLDLLLNEIEALKKYPYACNEQTASKIRGLVMEKEIRKALGQKYTEQQTLNSLLSKALKAQQYDGGWAWWQNGKSNLYITNYVINALLPLRSDPNVEIHVRNGLLYIQNQLAKLKRPELLTSLLTMSRAKHEIDYKTMMQMIPFDSLTVHQQWEWVLTCQNANLPYANELETLLKKANEEMLGALSWGKENYSWHDNSIATTVLAFEALSQHTDSKNKLPGIVQFFLNSRSNGYWRNTVESASIVSTILPFVLQSNRNFNSPASIAITGDTSFNISQFPTGLSINNPSIKNLSIRKSGGGLTYFTIFQNHWNNDPQPVSDNFTISTSFAKDGRPVVNLSSGEKITMVVNVTATKDAQYVMMEVPIPAGCVYGKGNIQGWYYTEMRKDKLILFFEDLKKGQHRFEIQLESRYNGNFTLNPAKASLMYFPTFYGRNELKKVKISAN